MLINFSFLAVILIVSMLFGRRIKYYTIDCVDHGETFITRQYMFHHSSSWKDPGRRSGNRLLWPNLVKTGRLMRQEFCLKCLFRIITICGLLLFPLLSRWHLFIFCVETQYLSLTAAFSFSAVLCTIIIFP